MKRPRKHLEITCTATDCGNGLHCFRATRKMVKEHRQGECTACGANPIDWNRVHKNDISDIPYTIEALNHECVRHFFWHRPLGQRAINHAKKKGKHALRERVRHHLGNAIGPAQPYRDGRQTPMEETPATALAYAQHATGTCCRKCLDYWHNIPKGSELSNPQLEYATELVCQYIESKIPDLTPTGERIPSIRRKKQ